MKHIFCILFITVFSAVCHAQTKTVNIPAVYGQDTSTFFTWQRLRSEKAGFRNLMETKDSLHFRLSTENQAVDIWTADYSCFYGEITNYTIEWPFRSSVKKTTSQATFRESKPIDTSTARLVYNLFIENAIFDIPTQDSIAMWGYGKDGGYLYIENATKSSYAFKSYWCPYLFVKRIAEAKRISHVNARVSKLLRLSSSFERFLKSLPPGTYQANNGRFRTLE
ncbi:MAG: hypothetical protein RL660_225 [Bacteroidota bacterium]|jgi:hypothetical protein